VFYGFNRVSYGNGKTADTWHCGNGEYQEHDRFLSADEGPVLGRHRMVIRWHGKDKKAFVEEERELAVYNLPGGQLVEFASRMRTLAGSVRLDGGPQHARFPFRAPHHVRTQTTPEPNHVR